MPCHTLAHPVVSHHLARLRDVATAPAEFRRHVRQLATLIAVEGSRDLPTEEITVQTPLTTTVCRRLSVRVGIVPILRAGLGMVDPLLDLIPEAEVWHLGLYRDEETALPVEYYSKLPPQQPVDVAFVVDPMLATGGSAKAALATLSEWGVRETRLLSIIASTAGIERVAQDFPQTGIFVCAVDPELNSQKYIVPGLGDAGDRTFNTLCT